MTIFARKKQTNKGRPERRQGRGKGSDSDFGELGKSLGLPAVFDSVSVQRGYEFILEFNEIIKAKNPSPSGKLRKLS